MNRLARWFRRDPPPPPPPKDGLLTDAEVEAIRFYARNGRSAEKSVVLRGLLKRLGL